MGYLKYKDIYLDHIPNRDFLIKVKEIKHRDAIEELYVPLISQEGLKTYPSFFPKYASYYEIGECKFYIDRYREYIICSAFLNDTVLFIVDNNPTSFYKTITKFLKGEIKDWTDNYLVYKYLPENDIDLKGNLDLYVDSKKIFDVPKELELEVGDSRWGINNLDLGIHYPYMSYTGFIQKLIYLHIRYIVHTSFTDKEQYDFEQYNILQVIGLVHNCEGLNQHPLSSTLYSKTIDHFRRRIT